MLIKRKFPIFKDFFKVHIDSFNYRRNFSLLSPHLKKSGFLSTRFLLNIVNQFLNRNFMELSRVIKIFESVVPNHLAEKWDNTGLLIEPSELLNVSSIFFTNDLTEKVLDEVLAVRPNLIISYHPPIFSSIKSLKKSKWKDRIILKCIENSIAVYSPHTSCDAVHDGVNDWLSRCFYYQEIRPIHPSYESIRKYSHIINCSLTFSTDDIEDIRSQLSSIPESEICDISPHEKSIKLKANKISISDIVKKLTSIDSAASFSIIALDPLPIPHCGIGRIGTLIKPIKLETCVKTIKDYLKLDFIRFSQGVSHSLESEITTVAVCAGSGATVLRDIKADLYITGEMSHHDLLDANHRNVSVVLCEHSNSERGYLPYLAEKLKPLLPGIKLIISSSDKDPVCIV